MNDSPKKRKWRVPLIATAVAVAVGGVVFALSDPNASPSRTPEGVAAVVGDTHITDEQLERAVSQARTQVSLNNAEPPGDDDLRREVLQGMVMRIIYAEEAKVCGAPCRVVSRDVDRELEKVITQNFSGNDADFREFLTRSGMTRTEARAQIREALVAKAIDTHYGGKRTRTLADARRYYRENKDQFKVAAETRVSHILVEHEAQAKDLRLQLVGGASFATLARKHSTDTGSAATGGALGALEGADFVEDFTAAAKSLRDGEISEPVKTQFGWHLIMVERRPAHTTPFNTVSKDLVRYLRDQEVGERLQRWSSEVNERWRQKIRFHNPEYDPYSPAGARAMQEAEARAQERAQSAPAGAGAQAPAVEP